MLGTFDISKLHATLINLDSNEYKLLEPISLIIEKTDDVYLCWCKDYEVYSEGDTAKESVIEMRLEIIDLINDLNETPDNKLSDEFIIMKTNLNKIIEKK